MSPDGGTPFDRCLPMLLRRSRPFLPRLGRLASFALLAAGVGCARFAPSGGGGDPAAPPAGGGSGAVPLTSGFGGVDSAVGAAGVVSLRWTALLAGGAPDPAIVYRVFASTGFGPPSGPPVIEVSGAGDAGAALAGFAAGVPVSVAVRAVGTDGLEDGNAAWVTAIPGAVRLVDAASMAGAAADGATPATAFARIADAIAAVAAAGGGSVHVAGGLYPETLLLQGGVAVHGGFDPTFDLAARDPAAHPTVVDGTAGPNALARTAPGASNAVLDGLTLDGVEAASLGVVLSGADASLANVTVRRCVAQGIRLSAVGDLGARVVSIHRSSVREHFGEGIEVAGTFDLQVTDCEVAANFNEGLEAFDLSAPAGKKARIVVRRSVFRRNGNDGLDVKIAPVVLLDPLSSLGARIDVLLEDCVFAANRLHGAKLDLDFVDGNGIETRLLVDRCTFRANALAGLRLDLDAVAVATVRRVRATANLGDGIEVTGSEAAASAAIVEAFTAGNGASGLSVAEGPVVASILQSTFALDAAGTLVASVPGATLANAITIGASPPAAPSVASSHVPVGAPSLAALPGAVLRANAVVGDTATFPSPPPLVPGDAIEIGDDGILRTVLSLAGAAATFAPPLADFPLTLEAMVFRWDGGLGPAEDATPLPGSGAADAGLPGTFDADGSPADRGATGGLSSPLALSPPPLGLRTVRPVPLGPTDGPWVLAFDRALDPATAAPAVRLLDARGETLAAAVVTDGALLTVTAASPPSGPVTLLVGASLRGANGEALPTPCVFHFES